MKEYVIKVVDIDLNGNELGKISFPVSTEVVLLYKALNFITERLSAEEMMSNTEYLYVNDDFRTIVRNLVKKVKGSEIEEDFEIFNSEEEGVLFVIHSLI